MSVISNTLNLPGFSGFLAPLAVSVKWPANERRADKRLKPGL
ncbi:Unknown protein sequence [Pseudomonas savastanoi pv. phaseolicola]|uniref:Uncharacterized protein n=2 Tax=Pseudomonas savastanoi TaxID=29438 RepID=A0A3M4NCZ4_PSESG|nr:Unknown protein sequence [Pseudomonas savastanoi pv. phaseolicola]RMM58971.1 hypothetical protein ALQ74_103027 [Pseudomonas savastanoi pv. glycinea]KPB50150.1 Unknown protein sequence [Pseudomonas savastanoi pv. phaseolicola]KPB54069.1 Unknown protein sequence [Pseudomonas savastanoi pv. phaseolicola]KPY14300.1 hypothetical protein ALO55_102937 [Pseudomonas savastanoi pv. phaseolicola]